MLLRDACKSDKNINKNINKCKQYDHQSQDRLPAGSGGGPRGCF